MKYNKVRGIVRAKYGSRIPKFLNPSGGLWLIPSSQQQLYNQAFNWSLLNPNPFMDGSNSPINTLQLFTNTASTNYSNFLKNNKPSFLNKLGNKAGQFLETPTGQSVVGIGLDYLGEQFNDVENSSGVDNTFAAIDTVGNTVRTVDPRIGLAVKAGSTLLKGINSIGGKRADLFSINQNTVKSVGGSYNGSVNDINNAALKAGREYGLSSSGKRHKANSQIREARRLLNIMTDIANEASDLRAMITDLNYIRHAFDINGDYDLSNIRVAKSGMKILDKINFVKSKKFNNSYINVNTKTIEEFKLGGSILSEWEPIIEDIWEIEEFKEGGSLQSEWEPVIELQEGGSAKKSFGEWFNSIPKDNRASGYDYKKAYEVLDWETLYNHTKDPEKYHLYSVSPVADKNGNYPFLKLGKIKDNPEIQGEFDWYNSEEGKEHKAKFDILYIGDRYYYVPRKFKNGGKTQEETSEIEETPLNISKIKNYYKDYNLDDIQFIYDESPRVEGNNLYVKTDEDAIHELWHFLSLNKPNEIYKEFYDNLNDDKIIELGGDINFVKRFENDPGHFYHPSELEARIKAAKFNSQGQEYTKDFFKNLRSDENKYGYNMRDLLHMYNDENLEKIFNLKKGGILKTQEETSEIKETTQKNVIPEGALHKNKHHMEHTEGLTQKGIPVVDNEGNLQAEIELNEWTMTLELTKTIEELYKQFYSEEVSLKEKDDLAISAGKILVEQILHNTDDRTGLIDKIEI